MSPYARLPSFKKFDPQDFLRDLGTPSKQIPIAKYTSKRKSIILYERFINSANFLPWFNEARAKEMEYAEERRKEAIYNFDVTEAIEDLDATK